MPMRLSTRFRIASLIFGMINAVLFGAGALLVLSTDLMEQAMTLLPLVVVCSFVFAAPIAWLLAPRLRLRFWRAREEQTEVRRMSRRAW
ncbi:hypothetical protein [Azospirillum agricola]|uniref:hypothetical protein n=1 Tax=Azospirillum agricola TaxID=1720247 RepID=UPI000A0F29AF|nr:hypothetical protein [Azospirillum agricola]SMH60813.1 hypothetical protein SAMN02982994_5755 [Azospirillum lipoferum]